MTAYSVPTELLYDIIERAWALPCNPIERIQFMTTCNRISKSWAAVFDNIFSIDIHVPCKSFYYHLFNDDSRDFSRCQTITFSVYSNHHRPQAFGLNFLTKFDMKKLISLHTMNIVYYEIYFPDPYTEGFYLALPDFLPTLSIAYTFHADTPPKIIESFQKNFVRESKVRYAQPKIGTLKIDGADEQICAIWESLFPTRGKLIRDGKEEKHHLIPMSSQYDPIYGVPFLLKNWKREQEFMLLHYQSGYDYPKYRSDSPAMLPSEDGWPLSPDITRDSSVASTGSSQNRRNKMRTREEPIQFKQIKIHSVQVLATDAFSTEKGWPAFPWTSIPKLGDVGYFSTGSGMFSGLFNAFEPHVVQCLTIPSLYGYGEIQVQSMKYDDWVHTVQAQGSLADVTSDSDIHGKSSCKLGSDLPEFKEAGGGGGGGGGMARAKRAMGFLKAASEKAVFGGIRMFKGKEAEFRYIDCKGKKVMETWFEENIEKVLALYRLQGVSKENLVLVTGLVA